MKRNNEEKNQHWKDIAQFSAYGLRDIGYKNGYEISEFFKKYGIGESNYGRLMDAAGRSKNVMSHRLYGHQIVFDFPVREPENYWPFLEHELSDVFTKQGLPILPGTIIEDTSLLKYADRLSKNWNFVNGFDILSATIKLYNTKHRFSAYFDESININSLGELAKELGVGISDLLISISSANPFLLIGAVVHMTSSFKGLVTSSDKVYFKPFAERISIEFSLKSLQMKSSLNDIQIAKSLDDINYKRPK